MIQQSAEKTAAVVAGPHFGDVFSLMCYVAVALAIVCMFKYLASWGDG